MNGTVKKITNSADCFPNPLTGPHTLLMTNETEKLTDLTVAELRARALHTTNRRYSAACTLLASAKESVALGDRATAELYLSKAKKAYAEYQSDMASQVAADTAKVVELRKAGIATADTKGVARGLLTHITEFEKRSSANVSRGHIFR